MFRRLFYLRLLRVRPRAVFYCIGNAQPRVKFGLFANSVVVAAGALLYQQSECSSTDEVEKLVPRRLQRFLSFASAEFQGTVYMTPQDLLDSLILDQPRERVFRNVLPEQEVDKFLRLTPGLKKADKTLFRRLGHNGLISYSEYLFLLTLLTKSESSFRIAFSIFDDDENKKIDKEEFLKIRTLINCGFNDISDLALVDVGSLGGFLKFRFG